MMNINQSVLANAVINITGNTRGFDYAINQTRKQMQGFLVFANAIGGKTGGLLANGLAMGAIGPVMNSVLGHKLGGKAGGFLQKFGLTSDPMKDVADAMDLARRRFAHETYLHKLRGLAIAQGNIYNGQRLNTPMDVRRARIEHAMAAPKMADISQQYVAGAASKAQSLALMLGQFGLVVTAATTAFKTLVASGMDLNEKMKKAVRVFGSNVGSVVGGYDRFGASMSRSQYLSGASGIGLELNHAALGRGPTSAMASAMARRAGELAESNGDDFDEVVGKMQSALHGSTDALKNLGVVLSDDLVRAYAFNNGMIKLGEHMSEQVAIQARYALVMSQTKDSAQSALVRFFDVGVQWNSFLSGLGNSLSAMGSFLAPITAGILGVTNALMGLFAVISPFSYVRKFTNAIGITSDDQNNAALDRQKLLEQAKDDASRADDVIRRERARQSSNVGYHSPEDFYKHIQKGIFGDPTEFQKRQTDLMHEFVIVSKETRDILRDFGYKVKDGSALLQP
jgi:hypothetical protein